MIPYIHPAPITILPGLSFHVFGLLVGLAVVTGAYIAQNRGERHGLSARVIADSAIWYVTVGFIFAHWFAVVFYYNDRIFGQECVSQAQCVNAVWQGVGAGPAEMICQDNGRCNNGSWLSLLLVWNGISSVGGFLGAAISMLIFQRVRRIPIIPGVFELEGAKGRPYLKYLDSAAYGMAFAWIFGRMACAMAHDHPGRPTNSIFGIRFPKAEWPQWITPEGLAMFPTEPYIARFDLGFMEMLWAIAISAVFFFVEKKNIQVRPGWYAANLIFWYAPYRLFLDSLRAEDIVGADPRNSFGLTPAQMAVLVMAVVGIALWIYGGRKLKDPTYMDESRFPYELEDRALREAAKAKA